MFFSVSQCLWESPTPTRRVTAGDVVTSVVTSHVSHGCTGRQQPSKGTANQRPTRIVLVVWEAPRRSDRDASQASAVSRRARPPTQGAKELPRPSRTFQVGIILARTPNCETAVSAALGPFLEPTATMSEGSPGCIVSTSAPGFHGLGQPEREPEQSTHVRLAFLNNKLTPSHTREPQGSKSEHLHN